MGQSNSQESKYQIELQIDKSSYQIQDTLYGYVEYSATQSSTKYDLELRLQFIAEYQQQGLESIGGSNTFIWRDEIIKNCSKEELQINEKASFQFDLDLISTTAKQDGWFFVKYYISACIRHRFGPHVIYLSNKDIEFQINRPFVSIQRPISNESVSSIKTPLCCNYGQIKLKVSLDEKDFQLNDVAEIEIDCDQSLATSIINSYRINFLAKRLYRDIRTNTCGQHIFNTIYFQGQQSKTYKIKQYIKLDFQEDYENWFHPSLECPNFTHTYLIQILCNTGLFTNDIVLELPIILYHSQSYQLKFYSNLDQVNRNSFIYDTYLQFKSNRFIELKIKQENWMEQIIDFPQTKQEIKQILQNNNLILIQPNPK